jgi:hypothetical protein
MFNHTIPPYIYISDYNTLQSSILCYCILYILDSMSSSFSSSVVASTAASSDKRVSWDHGSPLRYGRSVDQELNHAAHKHI